MKDKATFVLGILILIFFMFYAFTFMVDHNEVAVVTTFGRANPDSVHYGYTAPQEAAVAGASVESGALGNLRFRWPWPIQQVHRYDRRVRVLEPQMEEQQTADGMSIAVRCYVTWRVGDPLAFLQTFASVTEAERWLRDQLRESQAAVIGNRSFNALASEDESQLELEQVEQEMRQRLQEASDRNGYGVDVRSVGVQRLVLPQQVTQQVFERMRVTRDLLATRAQSEGDSQAQAIRSQAESARGTIMAFAGRRADAIRAEGEAAAADYYEVFSENEDFAIFLDRLDTYRDVFSNNTTFFIDASDGGLGSEFHGGPEVPFAPPAQAEASDPPGYSGGSGSGGSGEEGTSEDSDEAAGRAEGSRTPVDLAR